MGADQLVGARKPVVAPYRPARRPVPRWSHPPPPSVPPWDSGLPWCTIHSQSNPLLLSGPAPPWASRRTRLNPACALGGKKKPGWQLNSKTILLIEDDPTSAALTKRALETATLMDLQLPSQFANVLEQVGLYWLLLNQPPFPKSEPSRGK